MASIFLCHSSKDKFFVRELADQLRAAGVRVWLDEAEIQIGESLTYKIGRAIEEMDFFAAVLSSNSIDSEWVSRELQIAMQRELQERKVIVLPVLLEPVDLPPFLRDKMYADFTSRESFVETFPKLLKALGVPADIPANKEPSPVPVERRPQAPAERRLVEFHDLTIADLDTDATRRSDSKSALYDMHLALSANPPKEWREIFEAERRFPRHTMWRRAWIEGSHIVISCVPDELEKYHMRDLLQDVNSANRKYREYLTELAQIQVREINKVEGERQKFQDLKKRLGF